jgi:REP element-mobilizing transposase RayT
LIPRTTYERCFGGAMLQNRRRSMRPLSTREAIHLVMRSSYAHGPFCFLKSGRRKVVGFILLQVAKKYGARVYHFAIAGNHIHILLKIGHRSLYRAFVRVLSSKIAMFVMRGTFKAFRAAHPTGVGSEPQGIGQKFWQFRPFTRVVHGGRDFTTCVAYIEQNILEALGFVPYKPRRDRYGPRTRNAHR